MATEPSPVEATPLVAIPVDRELTSAGARAGLASSIRPVGPVCDADEMLNVAEAESASTAASAPGPARRRPLGPLVPPLNKKAKGSLGEALKVAGSRQAMSEAMQEYSEAIYAPQTLSSKTAMRATWAKIARKVGSPPLPLSVELVHQVAAALRAAGYKAAGAYVNEALQWHKREGHAVSEPLELAVRDAKRAVSRAVGPKRRAAEIKIEWLQHLVDRPADETQSSAWPRNRVAAWILGYHFILREAELSCIFLGDVACDLVQKQITIRLPVSKTDPSGKGCRRTLACDCKSGYNPTCVFCVGLDMVSQQEARLQSMGVHGDLSEFPLIGREDDPRHVVTKANFIDALKWDAKTITDEVRGAAGLDPDDVTGHSLRRSGCKGLARRGTPLELIQFMSRHSSQSVMDYVEEAMEECPHLQFRLQEHLELRDQIAQLVFRSNSLEHGLRDMRSHLEALANQWQLPLDRDAVVKLFDTWARPKVIANMTSKKLHSAAANNFRLPPSDWITDCGWSWAAAGKGAKACVELSDVPVNFLACDKCKPRLPDWATKSER